MLPSQRGAADRNGTVPSIVPLKEAKMPMSNVTSKALPFAGILSVALGALSTWITLVPGKLTAKNTPFWPFVVAGLITLVVVFAIAKARKRQRRTTPPSFSWGLVIAIVAIAVILAGALGALSSLLVAGTLKMTAFWWSMIWGIAAGAAAGLGIAIVDRAIARAKTN